VDFAKSIVGGIQGGLACTCVLTCMIFAAVSGSSVATTLDCVTFRKNLFLSTA
jgi:C4-dicarboxylate transporter, DctM subunit